MINVLIIGNGFDIANGLPTKFSDFAKYLLEDIIIPDLKENIYSLHKSLYFDQSISEITNQFLFDIDQNTSFSLLGILQRYHESRFKDTLINNRLIFLEYLNNEFLFTLFKEESEYWFDIESTYFRGIKNISISIDNPNTKNEGLKKLKTLNENFNEIKTLLKNYLLKVKIEPSTKVRMFIDEFRNKYAKTNGELFIIDFNYTQLIKEFYLGEARFDYNPIHGTLDTEIIFGWGNDKDEDYVNIKNNGRDDFMINFKTHQYLLNRNYQDIHDYLIKSNHKFQVHVLGHSLGLTDKSLLQEIFESHNCEKIYLYKRLDKYNPETESETEQFDVKTEYTKLTMALSRIVDDKTVRLKVVNFEDSGYFPNLIPF